MKQIRIGASYGVDALETHEVDVPNPGPGDVLIKIKSASLNYRDWEVINGQYHTNYGKGLVPLSDGSGEVVDIGQGVTGFEVGERVVASFWQGWDSGELGQSHPANTVGGPVNGMLSEYQVFPERGLVKSPDNLSFMEAATLPCAAVTAWQSLVTKGGVSSGEWVLVQGTGGVSMFALQIARMHGAQVIVLSSRDAKLDVARQHGAHATINYRSSPEWAKEVRDITGGRGVDHIVEVGGPQTFSQSLNSIAVGGQINVIGYLGGKEGELNPLQILQAHATIRGIAAGPTSSLSALCQAIEHNDLKPIIDREYHWLDFKKAFSRLESGEHVGKVVLNF